MRLSYCYASISEAGWPKGHGGQRGPVWLMRERPTENNARRRGKPWLWWIPIRLVGGAWAKPDAGPSTTRCIYKTEKP